MKRTNEQSNLGAHLIQATYRVKLVPTGGGYNVVMQEHDIRLDDQVTLDACTSIGVAAPQILLFGERRLRLSYPPAPPTPLDETGERMI
jgi:hypothetical protein